MTKKNVLLGSVCEVIAGQSPPSSTYNTKGEWLPFFQGKADFWMYSPKVRIWCSVPQKIAETGDILISVRAPVGPTNLCNQKSCIGRGLSIIRTGDKIHTGYLQYFLKKNEQKLSDRGRWSTFSSITQKDLKEIEIPLPSLEKQKRIVHKLDHANGLRQKRKQSIVKLDEYLKSVFLDMFGDPVVNPKNLKKAKIEAMWEVVTGNTPPRNTPTNYWDFIEWIKSDNINNDGHYLTTSKEYLSETGAKIGRTVPKGSILVTCIAGSLSCIGNVSMADREVAFNQQINAIVPKKDIEQSFLYSQILFWKKLFQKASTNSMKGMLSKSNFSKIELLNPPIEAQQEYAKIFHEVEALKQVMIAQSKQLDDSFNALMQESFNQ